jgi:hypothetical protein
MTDAQAPATLALETTTANIEASEMHEHEGQTSNPPSPSNRAPPALPIGANKAKKTQDGYALGLKYSEMFLEKHNLPKFNELTDQDVEADHLQNFIDNTMHWLAATQFPTREGFLETR